MLCEPHLDHAPRTRPSLLLRLTDPRDDDAWSGFFLAYAPFIMRHCLGRGLQEADAAEVTQDVLLDVVQALPTFHYDPQRGTFRAWLGTVTYRRLCRFWRSRHRQRSRSGETDAVLSNVADHRSRWNADVDTQLLELALQRVRPQVSTTAWDAFVGAWLHDEPPEQVAARVRKPIRWVYVTKSRVLKKLKRELLLLMDDLALEK